MPPDRGPGAGRHPDAAGWALGALDHADALAFGEHLQGCGKCQRAVAGFQPVAERLRRPSPEIELPPGLEERTIARVLQAAAAVSQPPGTTRQPRGHAAPGKATRWPLGHRHGRLLGAAAAVAAAAVIATAAVLPLSRGGSSPSGHVAAEFSLNSVTGDRNAGGQATAYLEPAGFKVVLHLHGLPPSHAGQYYGCWYVGPRDRRGQPQLITAGSFTVGRSGTADPTWWSAADPARFPAMEITIDTGTGAPGKQVLLGYAIR